MREVLVQGMTPSGTKTPPADKSPEDESAIDCKLMAAIKQGDKEALAQLYDRHVGQVYALCLRILHRDSEAEVVVSDVFWEIWHKPDNFDSTRGTCRTYLLTLARSRAIDRWRASKTRVRKTQDAREAAGDKASRVQESMEPSQLASTKERQEAVRRAVEQLSAKQRETLRLAYFEGLTHREIAEKISMPLGSVKTHIRNGLRKLRTTLSSVGGESGKL